MLSTTEMQYPPAPNFGRARASKERCEHGALRRTSGGTSDYVAPAPRCRQAGIPRDGADTLHILWAHHGKVRLDQARGIGSHAPMACEMPEGSPDPHTDNLRRRQDDDGNRWTDHDSRSE